MASISIISLYPLANMRIDEKAENPPKDDSVQSQLKRLKDEYQSQGMRRTAEGVLLVHEHGHPHVLLLQTQDGKFQLPGGELRPGEDEVEGMRRLLAKMLSDSSSRAPPPKWEVRHMVCTWYRPSFEPAIFPYQLPHITKSKERISVLLVELPEQVKFFVPKNYKLIAAPLFELYNNEAVYGPIVASLPHVISRFTLVSMSLGGEEMEE